MDNCQILSVDTARLGHLLDLLAAFSDEVLPHEDSQALRANYLGWYQTPGGFDRLPAWLVYRGGQPVGCVQLFVTDHPPMLDTPAYRDAELMNFFVLPPLRNQGLGQGLLDHLALEAAALRIRCIRLNSAPGAEAIYDRNGFKLPPFKTMVKWTR